MKKCKFIGIIIILSFLLFGFSMSQVKASMSELSLINTNPGEDSSTQIRLSWQSTSNTCTLEYTLASDVNFLSSTSKIVSGVKNTIKYTGNESYYKYSVELNDLNKNTKYIYKIKTQNTVSEVYSFKTANDKGNFNFALIGDIHANASDNALKNAVELIKIGENLTKDSGGFDFVLSQGDLVKYGQRYEDWQQWNNNYILKNYMFSSCPGNKEYYNTGHSITSYDWFLASFNNPTNGPSSLPTCYFFKYDSVLFFSLDNINPNAKSLTSSIQNWMEQVIENNEGLYQYIVVVHHYADFFSVSDNNYVCDWGSYNKEWYEFYDKYDVDFVISGDYHSYTRTKLLYNNEVSTSDTKGTIYVTVPMVSYTAYSTVIKDSSYNLIAKLTPDGSATHGASYFKVSSGGLTYYEYGQDGKVYDSVTVKPKHLSEVSLNLMTETVRIIQNENKTINQVYFNKIYNDIVSSISIKINGFSKDTFYPSRDNMNTHNIENLKDGDNVELKIKFVNGKTKTYSETVNLNSDFGEIYGFHFIKDGNKIKFLWNKELKNNIVSSFALYDNDALIANLASDKNTYESNDLNLLNKKITLKAFNEDMKVIFEDSYSYYMLGDYNKDNVIDNDDLSKLTEKMFKSDSSVLDHDTNKDNKFDIYDLTMISFDVNDITKLKTMFKVTFLDLDSNVVKIEYVEMGKSIEGFTLEDTDLYKFTGFDKSLKNIYQDTVIKAVYTLK